MGQLEGGAKTGELQEKTPNKIALPSKMTIMLKIFLSKTFYSKEHSPMAISMKDVELRHLSPIRMRQKYTRVNILRCANFTRGK